MFESEAAEGGSAAPHVESVKRPFGPGQPTNPKLGGKLNMETWNSKRRTACVPPSRFQMSEFNSMNLTFCLNPLGVRQAGRRLVLVCVPWKG